MKLSRFVPLSVISALILSGSAGCAVHRVKYKDYIKNRIEPASHATFKYGRIDDYKSLNEQARLPHYTIRERFELSSRAAQALRSQLGDEDYVLIGEVYGGGNARANLDSLINAMCKKAAKKGGDVVLVFNSGVRERPFSFTTPGYSTTRVSGSAYSYGNYTYGNATAYSTHTPGTTYSGVLRLPYASGLVFKHCPGVGRLRQRGTNLDDAKFQRVSEFLGQITGDGDVTMRDAHSQWERLLDGLGAPGVPSEAQGVSVAIHDPPESAKEVERMVANVQAACVTIRTENGHGSGVIITNDGYVVTTAHVVDGTEAVLVRSAKGRESAATVVRIDKEHDVALIRLWPGSYTMARLGRSSSVAIGAEVYAIGSPRFEELGQSVSRGIVSGFREIGGHRYIQSDLAVNPGNSGGPLVTRDGRVIGLAAWRVTESEGLSFFVPIEDAISSLEVDVETEGSPAGQ